MSYDPTHVVVAIQRAKDLISKGKNGTNDAFVTIALGDNKFQTTLKDKAIDPEWYEECDIPLPDSYNESKLILQVYHRNNLGIDQFLGHLELPLQNFDVYDPPKSQWYALACKPGQDKTNPRGEIEVRLSFEVKKIRDMDTLSTASAASKRFKMRKKVKGPKNEKTKDFIPDLNELPAGALDFEDIAENYASAPVVPKTSLSSTPASPGFIRNSPRSSKGYSPFTKRKSRTETDTPPSSNASVEDIKQKTEDSESFDGSFLRTHRRGGSGSDALLKQQKPNRRLLTARPTSSSAADLSSATNSAADESAAADRNSVVIEEATTSVLPFKPRMRTTTNSSQISNDTVPEEISHSTNQSKRNSSASSKLVDQPVLIDDETDSDDGYTPSPILPLVKKSEPDDIFTRMAAQQKEEEKDEFSLVKHELKPGEEAFTPVGKILQEPDVPAHSTPLPASKTADSPPPTAEEDSEPVVKHKPPIAGGAGGVKEKKGKKKGKAAAPAVNVFDLLMASDEPEYNVDDTLPDGRRSKNASAITKDESNPFALVDDGEKKTLDEEDSNPFKEPQLLSEEKFVSVADQSRPIEVAPPPKDDKKKPVDAPKEEEISVDNNPFDKSPPQDTNPFGEPDTPSADSSNPFNEKEDLNPFGAPESPVKAPEKSSTNPFGDEQEKSDNPFEAADDTNPFDEPQSPPAPIVNNSKPDTNPFEEETKSNTSTNPFEDDDEEEAEGSFNRVGSFARAGSSRFAGSGRNKGRVRKEKKKAVAPAPPKPERVKPVATESTASEKKSEEKADERLSIKSDYFTPEPPSVKSESPKPAAAQSPRFKFKKDKKAPAIPVSSSPTVSRLVKESAPIKSRSSSHNPIPEERGVSQRRDTDPSRIETVALASPSRHERQPAVGAEAPDMPTEPRSTVDAGVQVDLAPNNQEYVPSEFRHMSKQDLVDMVQKLRQQVKKKEEHTKDLEEYIDSLLLRVMSADPNLLVAGNSSCGQQANKMGSR